MTTRHSTFSVLTSIGGAATALLLLASCSMLEAEPQHPISGAIGRSVANLSDDAADASNISALDVSASLGGKAGYDGTEIEQQEYVVLSICSDSKFASNSSTMQIAIAARDLLSQDQLRELKNGQFKHLLKCTLKQRYQA